MPKPKITRDVRLLSPDMMQGVEVVEDLVERADSPWLPAGVYPYVGVRQRARISPPPPQGMLMAVCPARETETEAA